KPFDDFTVEQLAGDLLPNPTIEQRIATGFNRNHGITIEGGVIDEEYRTEYVIDRVVTTSTVWMGMTMICARCHDHKYDPISQREFYQLFAFFNQVPERGNSGFDPRVKAPNTKLEDLSRQLAESRAALQNREADIVTAQQQWEQRQVSSGEVTQPAWHVIPPASYQASSGADLVLQDDGSVLAGGKEPAQETYEIVLNTDLRNVTAIRLEALTHPTLPHNGPGRAFNSNFVLSEVEVAVASVAERSKAASGESEDQPDYETVKLAKAIADYSQQGFEIGRSIDGNASTGWAVDGPTRKENRVAIFTPERPFGNGESNRVRIRLRHHYGSAHAIGRLRLALSTRPGVGFEDDAAAIVAIPAERRTAEQKQLLRAHFLRTAAPADLRQLVDRVEQLTTKVDAANISAVMTMVMQDMPNPRPTHVLYRGQYDQPRDQVEPAVPSVFPPLSGEVTSESRPNRLTFARWLVSGEHPLTARVAVNRYWQHYYGVGLVKTPEDFGTQSEPPSHPQLLDWLATEFMSSGWDVKAMQRMIVTSATYRQAVRMTPADFERDPENRLLARGPRRRLEAEVIRDSVLAASGLLVDKVGGPSVYPYHPKGLWLEINNRPGYSKAYPHGSGEQLYRRSMYTFWKRTVPPPTMQTFDAPEREFCVMRRSSTNTPLQAFVLLHDPQFVEGARGLAQRMIREANDDDARLAHGFRLLTARRPTAKELEVLRESLDSRRAFYEANSDAAEQLLRVGESSRDESVTTAELAAWTAVGRLLLNLSETITKP
ncbi:MAG: DUF1553 domain-containing protein, partial [Planctomycetales bacterium]|nr:DUF1553 domain-containing protein [Planctomycetales bacterium]